MSPDTPGTPSQGQPDAAKIPEDAAEAKRESAAKDAGQPEPKPKRTRRKAAPEAASAAAGGRGDERSEAATAAAETGVDKEAAQFAESAPTGGEAQAAPGDDDAARAAEPPGDRAEEAAEEAQQSARSARSRSKTEEPEAPAEQPVRRRDRRAPAPAGVVVRAQAKYVRTSARKARLVCDHIRGKDVTEARAILAYTPRSASKAWSKLLESAVANAEHNHELIGEELRIASVHADEGPTLKRFRPRAMGRATRIRKRTSHLTITLTPKES